MKQLAQQNGWSKNDLERLLTQLGLPKNPSLRSAHDRAQLELALHYAPRVVFAALEAAPDLFSLMTRDASELLDCYWFVYGAKESGDEQIWWQLYPVFAKMFHYRPDLKFRFWGMLDEQTKRVLATIKFSLGQSQELSV